MKKQMLGAGIFILTLCCGLLVWGTGKYLKTDWTPDFQKLKSTNNGNQLTAEMRDELMDGLSKMQQGQGSSQTFNQEHTKWDIPKGAIMAFNLSSCPEWWSRFAEADGRFIMGSNSNIKGKGGNSSIMMETNQLADHSHYFTDIFFSENWYSLPKWMWVNAAWMFPGDIGRNWPWSRSTDADNNPIAILRKTWGYILSSAWSHANSYVFDGYQTRDKEEANKEKRFQREEKQQPLNIINPYIKLLYCQKD